MEALILSEIKKNIKDDGAKHSFYYYREEAAKI
ncbi:hypothetical protein H6P87_00551 [Rickettsia tillamookensis]|uniref:Uncharacterized protein n=1 Tax=Rickettsia tillamookensis TaxID=2761623 RepID=A0A9E6MHE0_9RICK|nr:hypothetical protein H6P87_00551 [Rickettsia tillamookensis]